MDKKQKRRANILYRLRKKGIRCSTREREIYFPYGKEPMKVVQVRRLCDEFNFRVQFEIV